MGMNDTAWKNLFDKYSGVDDYVSKYFTYKIRKLLDTTDTVNYTLTLNLKKNDDKWEIEPLTNEELMKLHGTYEY